MSKKYNSRINDLKQKKGKKKKDLEKSMKEVIKELKKSIKIYAFEVE